VERRPGSVGRLGTAAVLLAVFLLSGLVLLKVINRLWSGNSR